MSITQQALWIVERNLAQALSLDSLAQACGVSRFHLAHAFGRRTGQPVMQYLRQRRLSEAAQQLAAGSANILDLALQSGYASNEAFSRAFKQQFGTTPESVRSRGSTEGLALTAPLRWSADTAPPPAADRIVSTEATGLVALWGTFELGDTGGIARQWELFMSQAWSVAGSAAGAPLGVARLHGSCEQLDYACAIEPGRRGARVPPGLERLELPPRRYVVFDHEGHVARLPQAWAAVWDQACPAAGLVPDAEAPGLERHKPGFDPATGLGGVEIWLPLKGG